MTYALDTIARERNNLRMAIEDLEYDIKQSSKRVVDLQLRLKALKEQESELSTVHQVVHAYQYPKEKI